MSQPPDGPQVLEKIGTVSHETVEKLVLYASLLKKWQKSQNLVSPSSLSHLWERHMADSLQLLDHGFPGSSWIDLGAGAGFPGLVIAIAGRADKNHHVHLIESNQGKAAFLNEVIRATNAPATVHARRVEDCGDILGMPKKTITARAFAPLNQLCAYIAPYLDSESVALFPKGRNVESEITEALQNWRLDYERLPSKIDRDGTILRITHVERLT